jgi:hypothetical protein
MDKFIWQLFLRADKRMYAGLCFGVYTRVTSLGEFAPLGRLFTLACFFENQKISPDFGLVYFTEKVTNLF